MTKKFAKTQAEAASIFKTARQTFCGWSMQADFPKKTAKGWDLRTIDAWLRERSLGPHNATNEKKRATEVARTCDDVVTLTEAKIRNLQKRTQRDEIAIQKETIELELAKRTFVLTEEVLSVHREIAATTMTIVDQLVDAVDREVPEKAPDAGAWDQIRQRILAVARRVAGDAVTQIRGLVAGV